MECKKHDDLQSSTPSTLQSTVASADGGRSSYIGSIQALSAYYDDDDGEHPSQNPTDSPYEQRAPPSPLPFAVDEPAENSLSRSLSQLRSVITDKFDSPLWQNHQASTRQTTDPEHSSLDHEEGGIVISSPDNQADDDSQDIHWDSTLHSEQQLTKRSNLGPLDSLIAAAAAQVDDQKGGESYEKLMEQAENGWDEANLEVEDEGQKSSQQLSFWSRFQRKNSSQQTISQSLQPAENQSIQQKHPTTRAAQTARDKFLVEVDILVNHNNNNRTNIRDAMDILANVDLLHLWFDPIPAVFDSTIKDGSGSYSPANSSSNNSIARQERHRDGEWIEISTPPLILPKDSRISSSLRFFRVKFRSLIGFPARIRSTILIERSAYRMGMTIGPYPDGMTAYHDFHVRIDADRVVIADEVRLHRLEENKRIYYFFCFICGMVRWFWRVIKWISMKWYQPDLASYMSQTAMSMEKLRILIERGEVAAFASEKLVIEGSDWEGGENATLISAPLLG